MKFKSVLAAIALIACGSVSAQNVTKADLSKLENQVNALSQKIAQLEEKVERVVTENVNLVEQLNLKTVTSYADKNGMQWDVVKVEPNGTDVKIFMRITNNTGVERSVMVNPSSPNSYAIDSNSNQQVNKYLFHEGFQHIPIPHGTPVNVYVTLNRVPVTTAYLSVFQFVYNDQSTNTKDILVKFTGIHTPR